MSSINIFAETILANLFGSKYYKYPDPIEFDTIKKFCSYLDNSLPGFIYFENYEEDLKEVARKYPKFYKYENNKIRPTKNTPIRENFNEPYEKYIVEIIEKTADNFMEKFYKEHVFVRPREMIFFELGEDFVIIPKHEKRSNQE